jgi:ABC-type antimicrobial peptide transport system permease subunit
VYVAIDYDDRADVAAVESSLEELGYRFTPSTRPAAPSRVEQLRSVQPLLERLVLLLGVLGAIGLLHFLGLSVRRRAHDLAVLKALGFVHGQVRRAVVIQAVAVTLVGVAVGIPAGFVLGRLLWLGSVAALDILDDPASPVGAALGGGVLVVMAAGLLAVGPGIVAARRRASGVLRSE